MKLFRTVDQSVDLAFWEEQAREALPHYRYLDDKSDDIRHPGLTKLLTFIAQMERSRLRSSQPKIRTALFERAVSYITDYNPDAHTLYMQRGESSSYRT
jgi:hypothetical protein